MTTKIALMGAGGKMGCRITDNIKDLDKYDVAYIEVSEQGIANLAERGLSVTPEDEAVASADAVVLALPDRLIGKISSEIVPKMKAGAMLIGLDPAAAYAGVMPIRDELTYFITHPCHPPLFHAEVAPNPEDTDWFGGVTAAQHIVCALHHGPDEDYAKGEDIAKDMYGPILGSHRITVEQMALLEPALVETFSATLISAIQEGYEKVVEMGVPKEAAWEFLMGHVRIELAIIFGFAGFPFSDGAKLAVEKAKDRVFLPEWKENVFDLDRVKESVREITDNVKA